MSTKTPGLGPILAVNFASYLGFAIVNPFLVFLVAQWGGNALAYSLVGVAYSAWQFIGAPILGRWSDTAGRKKVLAISQAGSAFSWLIAIAAFYLPMTMLVKIDDGPLAGFALTLPLLALFVARSLDGLTGGNTSVSNAYVADVSPPDKRDANFGKLAASGNAGAVLGPALAGPLVMTALGYELPVIVAAAVCFFATFLIITRLPNTKPAAKSPSVTTPAALDVCSVHHHGHRAKRNMSISKICALPGVACLLGASFLVNLAFSIFNIALPLWAVHELSWSPVEMGGFFAVMGLVMVLVEGPGLRMASRYFGKTALCLSGTLILALGFFALGSHHTEVVFAGAVLIGIGNGLSWPLIVAMLSDRAGDNQGVVQGFAGSSGAIASIIGLLMGGLLYIPLQGTLFTVAAGLIAVVSLMAWWSSTHKN